jgi:hypothetical protein
VLEVETLLVGVKLDTNHPHCCRSIQSLPLFPKLREISKKLIKHEILYLFLLCVRSSQAKEYSHLKEMEQVTLEEFVSSPRLATV